MENCEFSILINGNKKVFGSDEELNTFINENYKSIVVSPDKTLSTSEQQRAITILDEIRQNVSSVIVESIVNSEDTDDIEIIYKIPDSIGVLSFLSQYGNQKDSSEASIIPLDKENWRNKIRNERKKEGFSDIDIENFIKLTEKSWDEKTNIGKEIHNVIDKYFKKDQNISSKLLSDTIINSIIIQIKKFENDLYTQFGSDAKIYSEFVFKSKEISDNISTIINKKSLNGRADLVVIDKFGVVHLFDFKTSSKEVGTWSNPINKGFEQYWHSTKKYGISRQMTMYKAMFDQYKLKTQTHIVPIHLNLNTNENGITIDSVNKVTFNETIDNVQFGNSQDYYSYVTSKIIPISANISEEQIISKASENYAKMFPGQTMESQIQQFEADITYYKKRKNFIKSVKGSDREKHFLGRLLPEFYFYSEGTLNPKYIYADNSQDLDVKLSEYVDEINRIKVSELSIIAENINQAINRTLNIEDIANHMKSDSQKQYMENTFKKYIKYKWHFHNIPELIAAGLFVFEKENQIEVVVITNKIIHNRVNFLKGNSILGNFKDNASIDGRKILDASYGNLEVFKALNILSEIPSLFENSKINSISAINPWHGKRVAPSNEKLLENWDKLTMFLGDNYSNKLNSSWFNSDIASYVNQCIGYMNCLDEKIIDFQLKYDAEGAGYTTDWLIEKLTEMRMKYRFLNNQRNINSEDPIWLAYNMLGNALMKIQGFTVHEELDKPNWVGTGNREGLGLGLYTTSIQVSPSTNARELGEIMNHYTNDIRNTVEHYTQNWIPIMRDFYKESGQNKLFGGEAKFYLSWFETNPDGTISDEFRLKDPDHPDFNATPKSKEALRKFLEIVNELRYKGNANSIENARGNGEYYYVPLLEAKFNRQLRNLGILKTIQNKWQENFRLIQDVFVGDEEAKEIFERENNKLYNRFNIDKYRREEKINKHKVGYFETDLERVLNEVIVQYAKEDASDRYIPVIQAMKIALEINSGIGGTKIDDVKTFIDKYVQKRIYGRPIIDEKLQPLYKFFQIIKALTSKLALGLNSRSFVREILQGTWIGLSRANVKLIEGVNLKNYIDGYTTVTRDAIKSANVSSLLQRLNSLYGMANTGLSEIAERKRSNWFGFKNWSNSTLFLTSTTPDFLHRMSILVAKMKADGCFDAHSIINNELVYDFKKDKRYSIYLSGDTTNSQYLYQKVEYQKRIEKFNEEGFNLKEGDNLPRAYTNDESSLIKNRADIYYGHYDGETKALLGDTFLGSFFMQYKNFIISRFEQWIMKPGVYNLYSIKQQYDPTTGEELWVVITYPNLDGTGSPTKKIVKRSDVTQEQIDNRLAEPYKDFEGDRMEGIAQSMFSFAKALYERDQSQLNELWKDPLKRANLRFFIDDLLIMMTMIWLVDLLYSGLTDDIQSEPWMMQWSYAVFSGSFQDGPIHLLAGSLFDDLNPPAKVSIERIMDTAGSVITGDMNAWYALTNTIGATRELRGHISNWI